MEAWSLGFLLGPREVVGSPGRWQPGLAMTHSSQEPQGSGGHPTEQQLGLAKSCLEVFCQVDGL